MGPARLPLRQRRGEEQALARLSRRPRGNLLDIGDPDGSTLDAHGPSGHHRQRAARHHPGRAGRQISRCWPTSTTARNSTAPTTSSSVPTARCTSPIPRWTCRRARGRRLHSRASTAWGTDGSVRLLTSDLVQPNGLAFSPDGKRLYIDDTEQREIRVYDVAANGELKNGRLFRQGRGPRRRSRRHASGCAGQRLRHRSRRHLGLGSRTAHHLGTIVLPESAANLNWGDADYRTLYITAKTSVYRLKTKTRGFVPTRQEEKP